MILPPDPTQRNPVPMTAGLYTTLLDLEACIAAHSLRDLSRYIDSEDYKQLNQKGCQWIIANSISHFNHPELIRFCSVEPLGMVEGSHPITTATLDLLIESKDLEMHISLVKHLGFSEYTCRSDSNNLARLSAIDILLVEQHEPLLILAKCPTFVVFPGIGAMVICSEKSGVEHSFWTSSPLEMHDLGEIAGRFDRVDQIQHGNIVALP